MVREGRIFTSTAGSGRPAFGSGLMVNVLAPGAQVTQGSVSTTITVAAGHGFQAGDKYIVGTDLNTYSGALSVVSVTATTLELAAIRPVASGDLIVNLGPDTGVAEPLYDGNSVTVYVEQDYQNAFVNGLVWADANGRYRYHHQDIPRWELVRTSLTPIAIYVDTNVTPEDVEEPVNYEVRYAHLFATSGTGTSSDPWVTAGSNPLQAAFNDLPPAGVGGRGTIRMIPGCYQLGNGSTGFVADGNGSHLFGFTLEGMSRGSRVSRDGGTNAAYVNDDGVILLYGGAGVAVKVGEFSTTGSKVAETCTLRNFKIRQIGVQGSGVGMLLRLFRSGNVEDINVTDFATGIALASVSDFNTFRRIQTNDCRSFGIDLARNTDENGSPLLGPNGQCNANWFSGCGFSLTGRDTAYAAYGVRIDGNAVKTVIRDSWIQNFDTTGRCGILVNSSVNSSCSNTTSIVDCYFEGNYAAVEFNNPNSNDPVTGAQAFNLTFSNNYVTQIEAYGLWVNSGNTGITDGVVCTGNTFTVPSSSSPYDTAIGVQLGTYIQNCVVLGNHFEIGGTTGTLPGGNIKHGGLGTITESNLIIGSQRVTGAFVTDGGLTTSTIATTGSSTLGDASTDVTTNTGRMVFRTISVDPTSVATAGTIGEVVYSSSTAKFYGKHTASATDTNWRLMGT